MEVPWLTIASLTSAVWFPWTTTFHSNRGLHYSSTLWPPWQWWTAWRNLNAKQCWWLPLPPKLAVWSSTCAARTTFNPFVSFEGKNKQSFWGKSSNKSTWSTPQKKAIKSSWAWFAWNCGQKAVLSALLATRPVKCLISWDLDPLWSCMDFCQTNQPAISTLLGSWARARISSLSY